MALGNPLPLSSFFWEGEGGGLRGLRRRNGVSEIMSFLLLFTASLHHFLDWDQTVGGEGTGRGMWDGEEKWGGMG